MEKTIEKKESIGGGMNEMKKRSTFRPDKTSSQQPSRRPSFDIRDELEKEAESSAVQSSTMMSLAAMENERKELMVRCLVRANSTLSDPLTQLLTHLKDSNKHSVTL